jgi:hypothetical protein
MGDEHFVQPIIICNFRAVLRLLSFSVMKYLHCKHPHHYLAGCFSILIIAARRLIHTRLVPLELLIIEAYMIKSYRILSFQLFYFLLRGDQD